jgi:6-phosphofructokinase 1
LEELTGVIKRVILARAGRAKRYGLVIIAEGVLSRLTQDNLATVPRDKLGRFVYRDMQIGKLVVDELKEQLQDFIILHKDLGFELRAAPPLAFDLEYGITLGFGAVEFLSQGKTGGLVVRDELSMKFYPLKDLLDNSGRVKSRQVSLESDAYIVAKRRMQEWL